MTFILLLTFHIFNFISIRGNYINLLDAFSSLDGLQKEIKITSESLKKMRESIHKIKRTILQHMISMYRLKKKNRMMAQVKQTCEIMKMISEASPAIDKLLEIGNTDSAIEIIENTEQIITSQLSSIDTARQLKLKMILYRQKIKDKLRQELGDSLQDFLLSCISPRKAERLDSRQLKNAKRYISKVFEEENDVAFMALEKLTRLWNLRLNFSEDDNDSLIELESKIELLLKMEEPAIVAKIIESFFVSSLAQSFQEVVTYVNTSKKLPQTEKLPELTQYEDSAECLMIVFLYYTSIHSIAQAATTSFSKGLTQICLTEGGKKGADECGEWDEELLSKINTFFAGKIERIIKVMRLHDLSLVEYYSMVEYIQKLITVISRQMDINGTILRASLFDSHKQFLGTYSTQKLEKLQHELEVEKWTTVKVNNKYFKMLEYIHNPGLKITKELEKSEVETEQDQLVSDEVPYWVVGSTLELLEICYEYLRMISILPSISYECTERMLECIQIYNLKASHLVLGAGAVQLSQMKNITAKMKNKRALFELGVL